MRTLRWLVAVVLAIGFVRLASLPLYPLIDRTEARYGEIARTMAETGDWVVPTLNGEPFWAKPPLSIWAQAASIRVFGANELAVRLPGWIAAVLIALLVWRMARLGQTRERAWIAAAVFVAAPMSIGMAGAVMTDPFLALGVALSLFAVVRWLHDRAAWPAACWFGLGLAVGTLAKGPIAVGFGGAPLGVLLLTARGRARLRGWPWLRSALIFLSLSVPWFLLAEAKTPGFLEYFFVGEHFHRFVQADWQGDRYGAPSPRTRGTIWLFFAIGFATWLQAVGIALRRGIRGVRKSVEPLTLALGASFLAPMLLFTLCGSVLLPYVFPTIPAASLLVARGLNLRNTRFATTAVCLICLVGLVALPFITQETWVRYSHKPIVSDLEAEQIIYCRKIDTVYSASFYGGGRVVSAFTMNHEQWNRVRAAPSRHRIVTKRKQLYAVPDDIKRHWVIAREFAGDYQIWRPRQ